MKKFICVFICLLMIMALICGCARSSEDDSRADNFEASRKSVEDILIDGFGAENLSFDYDESNNSYIVIIYVDFSYSTFWSSSDCASLRDNIDTMARSSQAVLRQFLGVIASIWFIVESMAWFMVLRMVRM